MSETTTKRLQILGSLNPAWNDISDKPTETIGGDTLTWDGNTEGRVVVGGFFCKVSDAQPTKDDFADGASGVYGGTEPGEIACSAADIVEPCDGMILLPDLVVVVHDKAVGVDAFGDGMVFSEPGTYLIDLGSVAYVASLTIPGYTGFTKEVLKKEVLPEHKHSWNDLEDKPTETIGGDTLTWDGNTEGLVADESGSFFKVAELMDFSYLENGCTITIQNDTENIHETVTAPSNSITIDDDGIAVLTSGILYVTEKAIGVELDVLLFSEPGIYAFPFSTQLPDGTTVSLTIPGYTGFTKEVLKKEVLPEHKHSWNDLEDKPFGDEWVEAMAETEIVGTVADGMYGAELTSHGVSLSGDEDQIIVIFDGAEYICDRFYVQDSPIAFYGNGVHIGMDDTGEPFLISASGGNVGIVVEDSNTHTVAIKKMGVKKLDEKYLPDTVATAGGILRTTTSDTLSWDGDRQGAALFADCWYKVTDEVFAEAELAEGFSVTVVALDGMRTTYTSADGVLTITQDEDGNNAYRISLMGFFPTVMVAHEPFDVFEKGTYFVDTMDQDMPLRCVAFTINGKSFPVQKVGGAFLPDNSYLAFIRSTTGILIHNCFESDSDGATRKEFLSLFASNRTMYFYDTEDLGSGNTAVKFYRILNVVDMVTYVAVLAMDMDGNLIKAYTSEYTAS